jgi:capsular exopolysaccharide synthesis family protein
MEADHNYNNPKSLSHQQNFQSSSFPQTHQLPQKEDAQSEQTVDLGWLMGVFKRRWSVMLGVTIVLTGIVGSLLVLKDRSTPTIYLGMFRVLVEPITSEGRLAKQFLLSQAVTARTNINLERNVEDTSLVDYETLMRVLKSPKLLSSVIENIQARYPDITYQILIRNLNLKRITYEKSGLEQGTKIMVVTYQDPDAEKILFVLEQVASAYLEYSRQERLTSLNQGIQFIEEQLPELQDQVDTLQNKLQQLRQQNHLIDPEDTASFLTDHALSVERLRVEKGAKLAEIQAEYESLRKQLENNVSGTSVLARDAVAYQRLLGEIQLLDSEIAMQSSHLRDNSAPMKNLRDKQQNLENLSRTEAQKIVENLDGKMNGVEDGYLQTLQAEQSANQRLQELPRAARKYADLQQNLEIATDSLKQFLSRREALKLDAAQRQVPWELIDPPSLMRRANGTLNPVSDSQTSRQLALTGILSLLLGVGVGFLVEVIHTVFHTPDEIRSATKLPVLGVIPFSKELHKRYRKQVTQSKSPQPLANIAVWTRKVAPSFMVGHNHQTSANQNPDSQSLFWEAFRSLYTNIRLQSFEHPIESLVIGAATPEDGKSTVALHLARTAAAIGQRVLLVDTDLRCPSLHQKLDLPNLRGLSDAIATDLSLNDAIQRSPEEENLFVLTAGPSPMDPMKLLTSKKMQYVHEQFKAFFDLVIYDTPPLVGVADGNYLATQTDGIVLVVGLDRTDRSMVTKALEGLNISGATVLGIVANGIRGYTPKSSAVYRRQSY